MTDAQKTALNRFVYVLEIHDMVPETFKGVDTDPLRGILPNMFPTVGDLRELVTMVVQKETGQDWYKSPFGTHVKREL